MRRSDEASEPVAVTAGRITSDRVAFVPYTDARWADHEVAGSVGLGFFAQYDLWAQFSAHTYHLTPRIHEPLSKRISRWDQGALHKCVIQGCVTIRIVDPLAGKPLDEGKVHPGVILSLTREERVGGMSLEVLIEATDRPQLPLVIANMPAHVDRMIDQLPADFVGATLAVVDVGPYPRDCPPQLKNGCVDKLARP